jgi:hypothetical protein
MLLKEQKKKQRREMVKYTGNKPRGVEANSKGGANPRLKALEEELIGSTVAATDEIGAANGSTQVTAGDKSKQLRVKRARSLHISQGKRQREPNDQLNWYAASAYNHDNVKSYWQKALDAEHYRHELPEAYSDYTSNNGTTNQFGLVQTAMKNYTKSKSRLSDSIVVGV